MSLALIFLSLTNKLFSSSAFLASDIDSFLIPAQWKRHHHGDVLMSWPNTIMVVSSILGIYLFTL